MLYDCADENLQTPINLVLQNQCNCKKNAYMLTIYSKTEQNSGSNNFVQQIWQWFFKKERNIVHFLHVKEMSKKVSQFVFSILINIVFYKFKIEIFSMGCVKHTSVGKSRLTVVRIWNSHFILILFIN